MKCLLVFDLMSSIFVCKDPRSPSTALPLFSASSTLDACEDCKYWTELRGTKLFLYNDKKQEKYTDVIELQGLVSVADCYSVQKQWSEVALTLEKEEVYLKTEVSEDAEEWKGFILTVVELSVPNCLGLLPGQLVRLKEVLEKETERRASQTCIQDLSSNPYEDVVVTPLCFHKVTRQEAADMLVKMPSVGNLILRPGADSKNYAVTIRESSDMSQVKHYRVLNADNGYVIELEKAVTLGSLEEVVEHFVKETRGKLKPFITNIYETQFENPVMGTEAQKKTPEANKRPQLGHVSPDTNKPLQQKKEKKVYMNLFPGKTYT
ncbi:signal-transducing adaptor protein 1 isoform X3 [Ascaphus truei]|uniref:signal-transducing adaptor protein 1 isoform X3 n=1 Tax=Ascaphus truei TaxID=8439 RepID=UPI003F59D0AD